MPSCLWVDFLSLLTVSLVKRTKRTGGKTPDEVNHPDNSDAPAKPNDDGLDKACTDNQNDEDSSHNGDEDNKSGSDVSGNIEDVPDKKFDKIEWSECDELD